MKKHTILITFLITFVVLFFLELAQNGDIPSLLETEAYAPPETAAISQQNTPDAHGKININTASASLLDTLDGIGPAYADRIIKFRTESGSFEVIHDIMKVTGIGEQRFIKIRDRITVK